MVGPNFEASIEVKNEVKNECARLNLNFRRIERRLDLSQIKHVLYVT